MKSVDTKKTSGDYLQVERLGKVRIVINEDIQDDDDGDDGSLESYERREPSVIAMLNYFLVPVKTSSGQWQAVSAVVRTDLYLCQPLLAFQAGGYDWPADQGHFRSVGRQEVPHQRTEGTGRAPSRQTLARVLNRKVALVEVFQLSGEERLLPFWC